MRHRLALTVFLVATAIPAVAVAKQSLIVQGNTSLQGEQLFSEVHVQKNGRLIVKGHVTGDPDSEKGTLHLKATKIVVDEGGIIDGTGAGFQGADDQSGEGQPTTMGGGGVGLANGEPGGGGAFVGGGGRGTNKTDCSEIGGAPGTAYSDMMAERMGSAGGAPKTATVGAFGGGAGGGILVLEANTIEINGTVTVAGAPGKLTGAAVSSGGGAGGTLHIIAYEFKVGPMAVISAAGGDAPGGATASGGGGGGGLILLEAPTPASWNPLVGGGVSGACPMATGGIGAVTTLAAPAACLNLDGDLASACKGDCDDVDPEVFQGAVDKCDGVDNDCNGGIDDPDDASVLCDPGQVCDAGVDGGSNRCYAVDGGPEGEGPAYPTGIEYVGGCNVGRAGMASVAVAIVAWALALARLRKRR